MAGRVHVGWRHLLLSPLLFSFLRNSTLSPVIGTDAGSTPDNPILYFMGFLLAALLTGLIVLVLPRAREALLRVPVAAYLLLLLVGTAVPCAYLIAGIGPHAVLPCGGVAFGFVSAVLFVMWCEAYVGLDPGVLARTAALSCLIAYILDSVCLFLVKGSVLSFVITFVAIFVSAVPLEALRREGGPSRAAPRGVRGPSDDSGLSGLSNSDGAYGSCESQRSEATSRFEVPLVKEVLARGWPVVAVTFISYMVIGFSWGNALFGLFDFSSDADSLATNLGKCAGVGVVALLTGRRGTQAWRDWLLSSAVGLLLIGWLVVSAFNGTRSLAVALPTGAAFGLVDAILLMWACGGWSEGVATVRQSAALAILSISAPTCLGIVLSPLLHGVAATLATPLCSVVFFVVLQATVPRRARRDSRETVTASLRNDLMEMSAAAGLSPRETDVFLKLAMGHSSSYIAEELGVSSYTVKTHVKHIYAKMGVHSKDEFLSAVAPGGAGKA